MVGAVAVRPSGVYSRVCSRVYSRVGALQLLVVHHLTARRHAVVREAVLDLRTAWLGLGLGLGLGLRLGLGLPRAG